MHGPESHTEPPPGEGPDPRLAASSLLVWDKMCHCPPPEEML